jgi:hypothetical protein
MAADPQLAECKHADRQGADRSDCRCYKMSACQIVDPAKVPTCQIVDVINCRPSFGYVG